MNKKNVVGWSGYLYPHYSHLFAFILKILAHSTSKTSFVTSERKKL